MTAEDVVIWAKAELQKNGTERYLPKITKRWYYRFAERHGFLSGSSCPIRETRVAWSTSENVKRYYDTIEEALVEEGIAERIEGIDGTAEYAGTLRILAAREDDQLRRD